MLRPLLLGSIWTVVSGGCGNGAPRPADPPPNQNHENRSSPPAEVAMDRAQLVRRLVNDEYGKLFYWPQHDQTIDKIWAEPANHPLLESIVSDQSAPGRARFVAAEVLFTSDLSFLGRVERGQVAEIYARALADNEIGHANPWGLLWENDTPGTAGVRFLMLGDAAIPALARLLENGTVVTWYAGSEEATVGNGHRYRIKDFAAYYLSLMVKHPIPFHASPADRDTEIAKLRAALPHPP
jgi:hypothetical protein